MPLRLKKFPEKPPRQEYYDDAAHETDVRFLLELYREKKGKIEDLLVGHACNAIIPAVEQKLKVARGQLLKLLPDSANPKEVRCEQVMLKKIPRTAAKAVHYACCDKEIYHSAIPQLQMVRDIMRTTISFPSSYFEIKDIGSAMIDIIDRAFDRKLVSVKNRFVEKRYPNLMEFNGQTVSESLQEDIVKLANDNLSGRDTFYRDLQLIVCLDNNGDFANDTNMKHVLLEIQLVSNALHLAKLEAKNNDGMSGHDMYKLIREVMEYAEYLYYKDYEKRQFKFANVAKFYPKLDEDHWLHFTSCLKRMWDSYSSNPYVPNMQDAIENSAWYARQPKP